LLSLTVTTACRAERVWRLINRGRQIGRRRGFRTSEADLQAPPLPKPKWGDADGGEGNSSLPSALEAFADVSSRPAFLKDRVAKPEEGMEALGVLDA